MNECLTRVALLGGALSVMLTGSLQAQERRPSDGIMTVSGTPPTGLGAEPTPTSIKLRWTCPEGATGYEVFATPKGGTQTKLTPTPLGHLCLQLISTDPRLAAPAAGATASFTHGGLAPATEFTYVVRALYSGGFGDSGPLTAQTSLWPAPTGVVAIPSGLNVDLQWNVVPGAAGYALTRETSSGVLKALTPTGCQTQSTYKDIGLVPGAYKYHVQSCPNSSSAVIAVRVGTVGYDMAVVALSPAFRESREYGPLWTVILRNEGDQVVQQASVTCTFGWHTLRSLSGGPTYSPGLETGFTVFTDGGLAPLYFDFGPGSHAGTCAVSIWQPHNVQDADPTDNTKAVTFVLPPANPPDLRVLAITREDCNGSFARQQKVGGDVCIKLDYRFDNHTGPTLLKGEWTIECTVDGVTERAAGPSRLFTPSNHTGIIQAMGFHGPGMAAPATRTVTCRLDPEGQLAESNERNNVMTTTLSLP